MAHDFARLPSNCSVKMSQRAKPEIIKWKTKKKKSTLVNCLLYFFVVWNARAKDVPNCVQGYTGGERS
jgi:hypothetical protein